MAITRRQFINRSAISAVGLGLASPLLEGVALGSPRRGARAPGSDKIIVTINLYGGNDGLNTVVPLFLFDRYKELRPTLHVPLDRALAIPGVTELGLNPGMTAIRDLYAAGKVAIINGVGVPPEALGLYDHFAAQYEFQSADVLHEHETSGPTGWVGRYLDSVNEGIVTPGIDFGGGGRLLLSGLQRQGLTINSIDEFQIQPSFDTEARIAAYQRIMNLRNAESAVAERNRLLRKDVLEKSAIVRERTAGYQPAVAYPDLENNYLSSALLQCAELIAADLGVRALSVYYDGYDTHANQNDGAADGLGYHEQLMKDVSDAVGAFLADLQAHGLADNVLILTISEFGRTPNENSDRGTDHGYGSCGFVIGNSVRGGVYGDHPGLDEEDFVLDGSVAVTTDFRSVYATVLANFLDADPAPILGGEFPLLGFL